MASALRLPTGTTNPGDRDLPNRERSALGELEQLQHRVFPSPPHRFPLPESPAELTDRSNPKPLQSVDPIEVNDDMHLMLAYKSYDAGDYKRALEHSNAIYERDMCRTNNLVLIGAIYFQMRAYDKCIEKNEEALAIDPLLVESYGNMGNAFREKGELDRAIQCYLHAIEIRPSFWDAWLNLSSAYMLKGRFAESAQCCHQALALNPCSADAHFNLGALMKAQGLTQQAFHSYMEAVRIRPNLAAAWLNIAGLFVEAGDLKQALVCYREAVKHKPDFSDAYFHMGNVYKFMGMAHEAIICYQHAVQSHPKCAKAFKNLATTYHEQGQLDLAIENYKQAISAEPGFIEAYIRLGSALKDSGRIEEAITQYTSCLALQPNNPNALVNLGNIYFERHMTKAAAQLYGATLLVTVELSAPFSNLAMIYRQQGSYTKAIACYNNVIRIDPTSAEAFLNRGNALKEFGRVRDAVQDYIRALTLRPNMPEAHANLASAYKDVGHPEAAIKSYTQALILKPDFPEAICYLHHTLLSVCNWDNRDSKLSEVEGIIRRQLQASFVPSVQPFHAIAYPFDSLLTLEISKRYASYYHTIASRFKLPDFHHPPAVPVKNEGGSDRLRVGYVSSDFGNHPLSHLMGSVFGMHNRNNIEVFCYALSPNDGSVWRQSIMFEAEHFIDLSSVTSDLIAKRINEDKIQILINLNGYTKGARNEVFAMQPAPIQVSYMGFPGTTGADYIQYLVTDEFVSPLRFSHIYSEKLVHLPHCYFVNDYKQRNKDALDPVCLPKRSDYGLPEDKFIFACFNQLYKLDPDIFRTWCNILKRVPNSALWLLRFPAAGETRLRSYAAAQGVSPDQIFFTGIAENREHVRRCALADLFLDTPLCNAHTTGTDVLWAGVPMITLPLEKMATRVAGSLCLATGVGEDMIVNSMKEYEEKAVTLAGDPSKLQQLRTRLEAARLSCPLFDTSRWVHNMERAFFRQWRLYCTGQQPQHFKVIEDDDEFPYDR